MAAFGALASRLVSRKSPTATGPAANQQAPTPSGLGMGDPITSGPRPGRSLIDPGTPVLEDTPKPQLEPGKRKKGRLAAAGNLLLNPAEVA